MRGGFVGVWHVFGTYLANTQGGRRGKGSHDNATTMSPQRDNSWRGATARLKEKQTR